MAERSLSWPRAWAIAWRDLKSAPGKFIFVMISVAVGVAALVGVRGLSNNVRAALSHQARSLIAADLSAHITHPPTATDLRNIATLLLRNPGLRATWTTGTISMASAPSDPVPLAVSLKAVDPAQYPYYGTVVLDPPMSLQSALSGDSAVVAEEFLIRTNAKVGATLRLGGRSFRIAAVLKQEPDGILAGLGLGPRVMISQAALAQTGLIAYGSRANERLLVKLPGSLPQGVSESAELSAVRKQLEAALPDAQVIDYREGNPALTHGLDHATSVLSLFCLVAMVLGAIGVAMAMHAHLERRMDMLAILKALGGGAGDLLRIFLLQTLALGLAGAIGGVAAGLAVMTWLPAAFGKLLFVKPAFVFPWGPALAGLGTGLLTTLLFCLPPLLDVRAVRPVLVLRRLVEQGSHGFRGWLHHWWKKRLQLGASAAAVVALGAIGWALSDSSKVGAWFALLFTCTLLALLAASWAALRCIRFLLDRARLRMPALVRHALANLYRPGNQSAAVLAALGCGVMLILTVYLMQAGLVRSLHETASPKLPNVFLVDMSSDETAGVKALFARQQGVTQPLQLIAVVTGRFVSINGEPVAQMHGKHLPERMLESAELMWADKTPEGDKITAGAWWKHSADSAIAMSDWAAKRLHAGVGSQVEIKIAGVDHTLRVDAIYHPDGEHLGARVDFIVPFSVGRGAPVTWYGGAHMESSHIPEMERALFAAYPTVTVINLADVLDKIASVIDQVTVVVRVLAIFSILAGLLILASSIAGTRFRRMQETVVLKTLGATRMRIARMFSIEFTVLGLLSGAVGIVFANLLAHVLLHRMEIACAIQWAAAVVALVGTAVLATATGWIASFRILGLRPLDVLREE